MFQSICMALKENMLDSLRVIAKVLYASCTCYYVSIIDSLTVD